MSYSGKVILIGNAGVGKTSLLARYVDGIFREEYNQTVGANFLIKEIDLTNILDSVEIEDDVKEDIKTKGFKLYFWDIGGQHDKLFANEYYFVHSLGALVVFNVADKASFKNLDFWISKMEELSGKIPFVLVGNQTDLSDRAIDSSTINEKAAELGVDYFETSAKEDKNVSEAFEHLSIKILNNLKK